jgi:hypothetical protein
VKLMECLGHLRSTFEPYSSPPLEPTGKQAAEAVRTRDAMLGLFAELFAVRQAVRAAREVSRP